MLERMEPKTLKWWLVVAAIAYFVLPFDLIPDLVGLPGRVDDVAVIALCAWLYRNHLKQYLTNTGAAGASRSTGAGSTRTHANTDAFDPYAVLGVSRAASSDVIQAAYRARMREYHPDKVAHLGEDLQKLAHEKSLEIQRAYRQLHG